jgi:hypothetical protein
VVEFVTHDLPVRTIQRQIHLLHHENQKACHPSSGVCHHGCLSPRMVVVHDTMIK